MIKCTDDELLDSLLSGTRPDTPRHPIRYALGPRGSRRAGEPLALPAGESRRRTDRDTEEQDAGAVELAVERAMGEVG